MCPFSGCEATNQDRLHDRLMLQVQGKRRSQARLDRPDQIQSSHGRDGRASVVRNVERPAGETSSVRRRLTQPNAKADSVDSGSDDGEYDPQQEEAGLSPKARKVVRSSLRDTKAEHERNDESSECTGSIDSDDRPRRPCNASR